MLLNKARHEKPSRAIGRHVTTAVQRQQENGRTHGGFDCIPLHTSRCGGVTGAL